MGFTIEQIDAKVAAAQSAVDVATEDLNYWKSVRDLVSNPRFAELENVLGSRPNPEQPQNSAIQINDGIPLPRKRGEMKRLALECLPYDGNGMTSQELAVKIAAAGYEFRTKTPHVSVNEALQTLKDDRKVRTAGRLAHNNAVLWLRVRENVPDRAVFNDLREVALQ